MGVLSRYLSCPEEDHMRAAKGVLRYLRGATRLGVVYGDDKPLQEYVDADWAGDIDARRSKTGFVFTLIGGPISWQQADIVDNQAPVDRGDVNDRSRVRLRRHGD